MSFILSKLGWMVIQPANLLLTAMVFLAVFGRMGRSTRHGVRAVTVVLLLIALTPVSSWVLRPLDDRYPRPSLTEVAAAPGVIVLGGPIQLSLSQSRPGIPLNGTAERYTESMRLAHAYPDKILAFSGGSGSLRNQIIKEGPLARDLFLEAGGLPAHRLVIESEARTTAESPALLAALIPPEAKQEGWLLVTSAWHMPRSVAVFEADGWRVTPYPVDYGTQPTGGWFPGLLPGLVDITLALHEWVGLVAYYAMGRTREIFPAP